MDQKASLSILPAEVTDFIIRDLEVRDVHALGQVNHDFHVRFTLRRLNQVNCHSLQGTLHVLEGRSWKYQKNLACRSCLALKPKRAFSKKQAKDRRGGCSAVFRHCLQCAADGRVAGRLVTSAEGVITGIVCVICRETRGDWCKDCKWCRRCAEPDSMPNFHYWTSSTLPRPAFDVGLFSPGIHV